MLKNLEKLVRGSKRREVEETVGGSEIFKGRFQQTIESTTLQKIEEIATAERSAGRSAKQRKSKKPPAVRIVPWSARMAPETLAALELIAENRGGKGAADGIHSLVADIISSGQFTKEDIAERAATHVAKVEAKKNKRGKN